MNFDMIQYTLSGGRGLHSGWFGSSGREIVESHCSQPVAKCFLPSILSLLSSTAQVFWHYPRSTHEVSEHFKKSLTKLLNEIMRLVKNFERPPDEKSCEKVSQIEPNGFQLYCKKKTNRLPTSYFKLMNIHSE